LNTYHPDTAYLHKQGREVPWLYFEARRGPRTETFEKNYQIGFIKCWVIVLSVVIT